MAKQKRIKSSSKPRISNDDLQVSQPDEVKFLVTNGTIALRSSYGLVDIVDGSLKISPPFLPAGPEIGIKKGTLAVPSDEYIFSIKDGILGALPDYYIGQRDIFQNRPDNVFPLTGEEDIYNSVVHGAVFDIHSMQMPLGIEIDPLAIREAAFTVFPPRETFIYDSHSVDPSGGVDGLIIKDGIFPISDEARLSLGELAGSVISPIDNIITIRDGNLIPNPNATLIAGGNPLLEYDANSGTLAIKAEPYRLTAEYTSEPQIVIQTQEILSEIDWQHVGNGLGVDILDHSRIQQDFLKLSKHYYELYSTTKGIPPAITSIPESVAAISSIEYFQNANLLSEVTCVKPDHNVQPIEEHLAEEIHERSHKEFLEQLKVVDADLKSMFEGAIYALNSSNPDRVRHFSISMRELFTQVLHRLSPDNEVRRWSNSKQDFDEKGRPTRKARLLYICRDINQDSFENFLDADVNALLEFMNLFQKSTHKIRSELTDKQLEAMLLRTESALRFLIGVSRA